MTDFHPFIRIDPVAFSIGPLEVHWYGIMYLLAFLAFYTRGVWLARTRLWWGWSAEQVSDFLFYGMLGVVIGGRLGYVLFYGLENLLQDPLFLFKIWQGGMSFHGGLLGVIVVAIWFGRRTGRGFWATGDFVAPLVPIGLALGRVGNFIGGELWGRHSDAPWAMIFPNSIMQDGWKSPILYNEYLAGSLDNEARHPSQLYQAALEGIALFLILAWFSARPRPRGAVAGLFLVGYGVFRFIVEFFREPDRHLRYVAFDWLTMGQLLSVPMVLFGLGVMIWAYKKNNKTGDS